MSENSIEHLRRQLREQFPSAHQTRPASESFTIAGLPPLPKATITELVVTPATSGSALIISHLLEESEEELPLALIDPADSYDPASYCPQRPLLWLRARDPKTSLRAADLLLRDGNLPLVFLDFSLTPLRDLRSVPSSSWYRLRNLAETSGTSLLAFTPAPIISAAPSRYQLENSLTSQHLGQLRRDLYPHLSAHPLRAKPETMGLDNVGSG